MNERERRGGEILGPGTFRDVTFNIGRLIHNFTASVPGRPVYFWNCAELAVRWDEVAGVVMRELWILSGIVWLCVTLCGVVWHFVGPSQTAVLVNTCFIIQSVPRSKHTPSGL